MAKNKKLPKLPKTDLPWLFRQLDKIREAVENKDISAEEVGKDFLDLLEGLTYDKLSYKDSEAKNFMELKGVTSQDLGQGFILRLFNSFVGPKTKRERYHNMIQEFWGRWTVYRNKENINNRDPVDLFVLHVISLISPTATRKACLENPKSKVPFPDLFDHLKESYYNAPPILKYLVAITEKLSPPETFWEWRFIEEGRNLRARIQVLKAKPELKQEIKEELIKPFEKDIEKAQRTINESATEAKKPSKKLKRILKEGFAFQKLVQSKLLVFSQVSLYLL